MINKVIEEGRLAKDVEIKRTSSGMAVCNFILAVERIHIQSDGKKVDYFDFFGFKKLGYGRKEFHEVEGYEVIKYKDFMKEEKKMTRLEYVASKDLIKDGSMLCRIAHFCKYGNLCHGKTCPDCEFNRDVNLCVQTLLEEYKEFIKIKLTKFEFDLLKVKLESYGNCYFSSCKDFCKMKEKGYFKGVYDTSMTLKEILDNCEVVE